MAHNALKYGRYSFFGGEKTEWIHLKQGELVRISRLFPSLFAAKRFHILILFVGKNKDMNFSGFGKILFYPL